VTAPGAEDRPPSGPAVLEGVLFDLDGTLLDTVEDISAALNQTVAELGLSAFSSAQVREMIGRGVPTLIERALTRRNVAPQSVDAAQLMQRFQFHYQQLDERAAYKTRVYPGVEAGLRELHARGLRLAVVTNKPRDAAVTVLARLGLMPWINVVVGGDSCAQRKPHPQPLLFACAALKVAPANAIMVGDSQIDVQAARAAGLHIVCVPYGYNEGADPRALACDAFVETLAELPALLHSGVPGSARR
jgi:phosphoglycolate phosphatase